jgi:hypothetical protein
MSTPMQAYAILEDDVDHAKFAKFAQKQGLVQHHTNPIDGTNAYFEDVWTTSDQKTAVHYVDDPRYELRFLWVRGAKLREILHEASKHLAFYDDEELLEDAGQVVTLGEGMRAVYRVGVGFPSYHPGAYQVFAAYLQHANPEMRRAALRSIAYHLWPESQPLLAQSANTDSDADVRDYARTLLDGSRQKHGDRTPPES